MSFGASDRVSTLSITWIIPLLVATSAVITVASLTMTLSPTVKAKGCPLTEFALMQSVTLAAGTSPATTW